MPVPNVWDLIRYIMCGLLMGLFIVGCKRPVEESAGKPAYIAQTTCFKPLNFKETGNRDNSQWCEYIIVDHPEIPPICWAVEYPDSTSSTRFDISCAVFEKVQKLSK
ncbi:hypothetical protein A3C09_03810 [Candidatus Uhrbacteria bacterium RIFCSPHIGHO2_02_FULL_47_44]|uniref:Uncharacterized protein n=1 Tax=Candidatus Uhrbacteria bacterium RIFCSPLOWO2_02_FULL_48_18 TaxID=1802408 RepID=A0A1F7VCM0_9BACT|nr:MAG: hypothetical protein A2839_00710 [Candidatus Uhrbacteria bacterium RIFCSPHIGHO2_01_FULL_47_10]OGL71804.1 MAG: hypothetical protein A3C09_03810 [Candidatus Uhrbacteria bacterium RIFCSPHIGHO2_02_FULL_47_44]OGL80622.1 MAG: hypothetical protein A3B20_04475 [Candidatus Uhrbacteria bacterium RIFCSPLOWO2_01_FULL_47_17]OGL88195.1 MAG: hypothetical protein A3I41_00505 [Candidatus Uhrbacteria bacterium RIFCSPLOWO2_02_FULL_48_18]OGL92348.1 MAG: hypothetical protein A3H12_03270 [Candidatus Uhrbacte